MRFKSFIIMAALIFAVSSVSAQDLGAPDSLKLVALTTLTTGLSTQPFVVECSVFVDSNDLSALIFGWDWDNANLQMDSAIAQGDFNNFVAIFFYEDDDINITNTNQRALASGVAFTVDFPANASGWRRIATYYMTMTNWIGGSSLTIDTSVFSASSDLIFLNSVGGVSGIDYDPIWGGPIIISGTAVEESITDILPTSFELDQNYPNPFNPSTSIWFDLPARAKVTLTVFNLLGQEVSTLVDEDLPAGRHLSIWDGHSDNGASVASGIYFYKLIAESGNNQFVETKKMMLLK